MKKQTRTAAVFDLDGVLRPELKTVIKIVQQEAKKPQSILWMQHRIQNYYDSCILDTARIKQICQQHTVTFICTHATGTEQTPGIVQKYLERSGVYSWFEDRIYFLQEHPIIRSHRGKNHALLVIQQEHQLDRIAFYGDDRHDLGSALELDFVTTYGVTGGETPTKELMEHLPEDRIVEPFYNIKTPG